MSTIQNSLKNKLLSVLKTDDFWSQLLEAVGEEMDLLKNDISKTKDYFNIYNNTEDKLIDISNEFGYSPNLIINNDKETIIKELESIPFRIRNKSTYDGYYVILKQIQKIGEIYNYYWGGRKLIKAIKWNDIIDALNTSSKTEPFLDIIADKNFSTISTKNPISLDSDIDLDEKIGQWNWQLDENMEISPTKHLGIEYYPRDYSDFAIENQELMSKEYLQYLATGVEYTRRLPIVPHIGLMLTSIMSEDGSCNYFNNLLEYSIPKLKLKCGTGFVYNSRLASYGQFDLDNEQELDPLVMWNLDKNNDISSRYTINDFKYISCGCGSLNILNEDNVNLFPNEQMVLFYPYSDEDDTLTIKDYSFNNSDCTINCIENSEVDTKKIKGIVGGCVNFQGTNYLRTNEKMQLNKINQSFGFWLNANCKDCFEDTEEKYIFDFGTIKVKYVYSEQKLYYVFGTIEDSFDVSRNQNHHIIFEINDDEDTLNIFLDSEKVAEQDISSEDYDEYEYMYIGIDSELTSEKVFQGIIDSTWIFNKIFTQKEKEYIFNHKQGIITQLGNKLATYPLDIEHEGYVSKVTVEEEGQFKEVDDWYLIQSHIKANDITDEFVAFALNPTTQESEYVNVFYNGQYVRYSVDGLDYYDGRYNFIGATSYSEVYIRTIGGSSTYLYKDPDDERYYFDKDREGQPMTTLPEGYEKYDYDYYKNILYTQKHIINTNYGGNTNFYPVESEYFNITYEKLAPNGIDHIKVNLKADNHGNLYNEETNESVSGYINYNNGEFEFNSVNRKQVTQEVLNNSPSSNVIFTRLQRGNSTALREVIKKTLKIKYTIGNDTYIANDNGLGTINGMKLGRTMIDYESGDIYIEFTENFTGDVLAYYSYDEDLEMIKDSSIVLNYKTTNAIKVSEIALENENHEIMAYMTFPPVEFYSINNHISTLFAIKLNQ